MNNTEREREQKKRNDNLYILFYNLIIIPLISLLNKEKFLAH